MVIRTCAIVLCLFLTQVASAAAAANNSISVTIRYADGNPVKNQGVTVYTTKQDVNGSYLRKDRVQSVGGGDTGVAQLRDLADGVYLLGLDNACGPCGNPLGSMGYNWEQVDRPISLSGGKSQNFEIKLAQLKLTMRWSDGRVVQNQGVSLFTLKKDANGDDLLDRKFVSVGTGDVGQAIASLIPGKYDFGFDDNCGPCRQYVHTRFDGLPRPFTVNYGQVVDVQAQFGRIAVILRGSDGALIRNQDVEVYGQRRDANGNLLRGDRIDGGNTRDVGELNLEIPPGTYFLHWTTPSRQSIDTPDVPVISGQITGYDGQSVQLPPGAQPPAPPAPQPAIVPETPEPPYCAPAELPQFAFGFAILKSTLGLTMGDPVECEHTNADNGDSLMRTTTGLSFYRKSTNTPTFTSGFEHWAVDPTGLIYWTGDAIDPPSQ